MYTKIAEKFVVNTLDNDKVVSLKYLTLAVKHLKKSELLLISHDGELSGYDNGVYHHLYIDKCYDVKNSVSRTISTLFYARITTAAEIKNIAIKVNDFSLFLKSLSAGQMFNVYQVDVYPSVSYYVFLHVDHDINSITKKMVVDYYDNTVKNVNREYEMFVFKFITNTCLDVKNDVYLNDTFYFPSLRDKIGLTEIDKICNNQIYHILENSFIIESFTDLKDLITCFKEHYKTYLISYNNIILDSIVILKNDYSDSKAIFDLSKINTNSLKIHKLISDLNLKGKNKPKYKEPIVALNIIVDKQIDNKNINVSKNILQIIYFDSRDLQNGELEVNMMETISYFTYN